MPKSAGAPISYTTPWDTIPAFPGHDGLASYCAPCHGAKTARGVEAGAIKTKRPRKGCDVNGNPLDHSHPWHSSKKSLRADVPQTDDGLEFSISSEAAVVRSRS